MELQKLFKNSKSLRLKKKAKPVAELDKHLYISEIKQLSPVKVLHSSSETGEIPFNLGKSEKFDNKPQIIAAFTDLGYINDKPTDLQSKLKSPTKEKEIHSIMPMSVEHIIFKKTLTPYSPGVVRIRPKETNENFDSRKNYFLSSHRQLSTPQPSISSKYSSYRFANSPNKTRLPVCVRTVNSFEKSAFDSPDKKKVHSSRFVKAKEVESEDKHEEEVKSYMKSPEILEYNGNYLQGQREGYGEILFKNGDKFKGFLKKGIKEGTGKFFYCRHKMKLIGEFKNDVPHGPAVLKFTSGDVFKVNFSFGKLDNTPVFIKFKDASEYDGEFLNGRRHGFGKMDYSNGGCYSGKWVKDQRQGTGLLTYKACMFFEGNFFGDFTDGPGVLVRKDIFHPDNEKIRMETRSHLFIKPEGAINKKKFFEDFSEFTQFRTLPLEGYDLVFMTLKSKVLEKKIGKNFPDGKFWAGKMQGAGMAKYGLFGVYYGSFIEGRRAGYGVMKYTDPEHLCEWFEETEGEYVGDWKDDMRHGNGTMTWPNGIIYTGGYNHNRRHHVIGKINFLNGDIYEGGWVEDRMEGACTLNKKGMIVKGQYKGGILTNLATLIYPDGRIYDGEISNCIPHGSGKMKWLNNNLYTGDFCEGTMDGQGRMIYANGDFYDGNWEHGAKNGRGCMVYANKDRYEGEWMEDKRSGEGVLKNSRGEVIRSGYWSNNEIVA